MKSGTQCTLTVITTMANHAHSQIVFSLLTIIPLRFPQDIQFFTQLQQVSKSMRSCKSILMIYLNKYLIWIYVYMTYTHMFL